MSNLKESPEASENTIQSSEGLIMDENVLKTPEKETIEASDLDWMEILPLCSEGRIGTEEIHEKGDETIKEMDASLEMEELSSLKRRVKELEEQMIISEEELKEAFDVRMSSVQMQHEKEKEKLKVRSADVISLRVTCDLGSLKMLINTRSNGNTNLGVYQLLLSSRPSMIIRRGGWIFW